MSEKRASFEDYYSQVYGDRWEELRGAMGRPPSYFRFEAGLRKPYFLDDASFAAALELEVHPGHSVLDMCAAPGGKTLVLATELAGKGKLVANDRSGARRARLAKVLREHLPEPTLELIRITGHDASRWGLHETNAYDRVLADVPCSSERHVMTSAKHLKSWSPSRTRRLSLQAYAILAAALDAALPGGIVLYVTCSISPLENDGVMAKLQKRRAKDFELLALHTPNGEPTDYGRSILPDVERGSGPLYMAKLRKRTDETGAITSLR